MTSPSFTSKCATAIGRPSHISGKFIGETIPFVSSAQCNGYRTQQAAANAGEKALRRFLESEALKQEQGIMADKHSKPPETPYDNAKSIDRWDDEGGAPSGGLCVPK